MNVKIFKAGIVCLVSCLLSVSLKAQNENEDHTLFKSGNFENLGVMLAPSDGYTRMDGTGVSLANIRAGVIVQEKFTFGAFYGFSLNDIDPESETVNGIYMDFRSYGGFAEYTIRPSELIHFSFPLFIGAGEVEMDNDEGSAGLGEENFFLVEPGALLEINLHKYVRFNIGASYRFVGDMSYRNMSSSDISGLTGQVGLKFGVF